MNIKSLSLACSNLYSLAEIRHQNDQPVECSQALKCHSQLDYDIPMATKGVGNANRVFEKTQKNREHKTKNIRRT